MHNHLHRTAEYIIIPPNVASEITSHSLLSSGACLISQITIAKVESTRKEEPTEKRMLCTCYSYGDYGDSNKNSFSEELSYQPQMSQSQSQNRSQCRSVHFCLHRTSSS